MNIQEKAAWGKRLRADDAFQMLIAEVRDTAVQRFLNSATSEDRENAHSLVRALNEIDGTLQAWIDAKTVADKKGQN